MKFAKTYYPTTAEARAGTIYIATWEDEGGKDDSETLEGREFGDYRTAVLDRLTGDWTTDTDDTGVFLVCADPS